MLLSIRIIGKRFEKKEYSVKAYLVAEIVNKATIGKELFAKVHACIIILLSHSLASCTLLWDYVSQETACV